MPCLKRPLWPCETKWIHVILLTNLYNNKQQQCEVGSAYASSHYHLSVLHYNLSVYINLITIFCSEVKMVLCHIAGALSDVDSSVIIGIVFVVCLF